ncbi:SET and MYND domain-containing protein 3 [Nowakowskiella sp. JEL0078]|nr:SET and MYND domain-containing protein 3 [Nowakowskiella sp. JEL0078]
MDIPRGTKVFSSSAIAIAGVSKAHCWSCLSSLNLKFSRCSSCKRASYCSRNCQAYDWKHGHSQLCEIWKSRSVSDASDSELQTEFEKDEEMLLKIALALSKHNNRLDDNMLEELAKFEAFVTLETHLSELDDKIVSTMKKICKSVKSKLPTSDPQLLLSHLAKFRCNNFSIHDSQMFGGVGEATFPLGALINHSCIPNCSVMYEFGRNPGKIYQVITTLRNINAGEELTDAYVDGMAEKILRRNLLLDRYKFLCECSRCSFDKLNPNSNWMPSGYFRVDELMSRETKHKSLNLDENSVEIWLLKELKKKANLIFGPLLDTSGLISYDISSFSAYVMRNLIFTKTDQETVDDDFEFLKRHDGVVSELSLINLDKVPAKYPFKYPVWNLEVFKILSPKLYEFMDKGDWNAATILAQYVLAIYKIVYPRYHPMVTLQWIMYGKCVWNQSSLSEQGKVAESYVAIKTAKDRAELMHLDGDLVMVGYDDSVSGRPILKPPNLKRRCSPGNVINPELGAKEETPFEKIEIISLRADFRFIITLR